LVYQILDDIRTVKIIRIHLKKESYTLIKASVIICSNKGTPLCNGQKSEQHILISGLL